MVDIQGVVGQPARLSIVRSASAGVCVLTLRGELDADTAGLLREALTDDAAETPPRTVLDFDAVTFMDSSGINVLVAAHRAADAAGGWIRLARLAGPVRRVVELVGLDTIIACRATVDEARNL
ncbi:STAS domain-containing protein [Streptomyces ziwulingensis]|uniref:Anti-sigma factor antagonist n=1 Tax=Streptomyces ziwulingensis TaxID=1045501 RepID=A0ABP9C6H1_9ACTN